MVCFNAKGDRFLYQDRKGFEDEWRKHHTSSITRDIWIYDTTTRKHTNLTHVPEKTATPYSLPTANRYTS